MPRVQILPDNLANRIAAGEVVERPASIVKELVENALDAGAHRIEVTLREGGLRLLQVTDDGVGMPLEDLVLSVHRFATSKVAAAEDLDAIGTLGFRGEALPSIGAVAQLKITTRPPEQAVGHALLMEGGEISAVEEVGCAPGTTVAVANLFYNTPARRKFLGNPATERGHCADWIVRLALARPEVSFRLVNNDTQVLATRGTGDLAEALAACLGGDVARELLPVRAEAGSLSVEGYVSTPRLLRATRRHQFFYVNGRYVRSRALGLALDNAYGMLLPAGRQPLCALKLRLGLEEVDPNVHPTKIEVRFRRPGEVFSFTERAVEEALAEAGYRSLSQRPRRADAAAGPSALPEFLPAGRVDTWTPEQRDRVQRLRVNPFFNETDERDSGLEVHTAEAHEPPAPARFERPVTVPAPGQAAVLGQLWGRYLVVSTEEDLLLVDQHRAAERVLFEELADRGGPPPSQLLALPQTLELPGPEYAALAAAREELESLGYQLEEFGGASFLVRAVPAATVTRDPVATLSELAAELADSGSASLDAGGEELRARVACHAAVKAGHRLTEAEMDDLLRALLRSTAPATCPHGDPILISFPVGQVDRRFHR